MKPLRVAIVGCGIGRLQMKAFKSLPNQFILQAICDVDHDKASKAAEEFQVKSVTTDFAQLCKRDDIDIISVCTPPYLHYEQTLQALASGKHVICEKPHAASIKQIDDIKSTQVKSGKHVMPIFQYRFGNGLQKLKFLINEGLAGKAYLSTVDMSWRRRPEYYMTPWRGKMETELGGVLLSMAIHFVDILLYVSGPAKKVFARTTTRVNPVQVEDCVSASLEMADGSLASISTTLGSSDEITRHRFCFAGFSAESNNKQYNTRDPWRFIGDSPEKTREIEETLLRFNPTPDDYEGQFSRFFDALDNGKELPVTLDDARATLELISAMYYSAATHEEVKTPIAKGHSVYTGWQKLATEK